MKNMMILALCAMSAACGGRTRSAAIEVYAPSTPQPELPVVTVWVDDDPDLPLERMRAGCDIWKAEGARCEFGGSVASSKVRIWPYHGACVLNDDGTYTLATAYPDGKIIFNIECFRRGADKKYDLDELAIVMGHELGHQFGVWDHVPAACDAADVKTHPDGQRVCGPALMNPIRRKDIRFLTPIDHLAFDLRSRTYSVLTIDEPGADNPTCVYRVRP